ncbi:MAG TPA: glycosyltransferase [Syntrophales bacterium]|nr:glycosyltransferase [Syntrophales bacterium]
MNISVVIPVHNGGPYLAQAIESVLAQSWRDLELLIVDDGSTDGSSAVAERYARCDRRIRLVSQANRGVAAAANRGLEEARGQWVARLDADDVFLPDKLERQVAFLARYPDARIVGTLGYFINHSGRTIGLVSTDGPFTPAQFETMAARGEPVFFVHSSTLMHRRTVLEIGGYRERFIQAEDVDLWLRMAGQGHLLLKMPEPLLLYRLHGDSLTMKRNAEQKRCHRWVMACADARGKGREEPLLEEFLRAERRRPWPVRFRAWRREAGERYYQTAALRYADGNCAALAAFLCLAACLNPAHVLPRLYDRKIAPMLERSLPETFPAAVPGRTEACRHAPGN